MHNKPIHIISFDNPYPPVYGGIIEVFYKVKALHKLGYQIFLHCFVGNNAAPSLELEAVTEKIFFYKTSAKPWHVFSGIPYSVISRRSDQMLQNVLSVKAPILFEGLKTVFIANHPALKAYFKVLRLHNIEQDYFLGISRSENSLLHKALFYLESIKYKNFDHIIDHFDKVLTLSRYENDQISKHHKNAQFIPIFHGNQRVCHLEGKGDYALYHGDLGTADNRAAVVFLVDVFREIPGYNLIIASSSGGEFVAKQIRESKNIQFTRLNNFEHLQQLLHDAHICISWSFQKSGTKLKVVNALFNSRFSIINENIIDDPIIADLCVMVSDKKQLVAKINVLKQTDFNDFNNRKSVLEVYLADDKNAAAIDNLMP